MTKSGITPLLPYLFNPFDTSACAENGDFSVSNDRDVMQVAAAAFEQEQME